MGLCPTATKSIVNITFGDGSTKKIETPGNISIDVINTPSSTNVNCYRFWAIGGQNAVYTAKYLYEYYVCAATVGFTSAGTTTSPIWTGDPTTIATIGVVAMVVDGKRLFNDQYFSFGSGFEHVDIVTNFPITNNNAYITSGNCNSCKAQAGKCSITIKSSGGIILYQANGGCPITYEVDCDDDCHDGCCKIVTQTYPGYCCAKSP